MRGALFLTFLLFLLVIIPWKPGTDRARETRVRLAAAIALNVLLVLLIVVPWRRFQNDLYWERVRWVPFLSPPWSARDLIGNVMLYSPFGYAVARLAGTPYGQRLALIGAAVLALATEASQLLSTHRYPSMTDVTCNLLGAWLGTTVARWPAGDSPR